jgi:hypothetical protein
LAVVLILTTGGNSVGIKGVETKDAGKHPGMHETAAYNKELFGPKYQRFEKPCRQVSLGTSCLPSISND